MSQSYHAVQLSLFPFKECTACHIEKPFDEFYTSSPSRGTKTSHQPWCKSCWNEKRRQKRLLRLQTPPILPASWVCIRCGIEKPISGFYRSSYSDSGIKSACKVCCDKKSGYRQIGKIRDRRNQDVAEGYKWCYGCQQEKSLDDFWSDKTKRDGLYPRCKDCHAIAHQMYWENNKERLTQQRKEWYAIQENRLKMVENNRRRLGHIFAYAPVDYESILTRDGSWCYICECPILPGQDTEFDHVIPLIPRRGTNRKPGAHVEDNIKVAHKVCNRRKRNKLLEEMTPFQRRGVV